MPVVKPHKEQPPTIINLWQKIRKNLGNVTGVEIGKARDVIIYPDNGRSVVIVAVVAIISLVLVLVSVMIIFVPTRNKPPAETSRTAAIPPAAVFLSPTPPAPASIQTFTPEASSTDTPQPTHTATIVSPTKAPDLADLCINPAIWTPSEGNAHPVDDFGCWDLREWGIEAAEGGLKISSVNSGLEPVGSSMGIYREITPNTRIDFTVHISDTYPYNIIGFYEPQLVIGILPDTLRSQDIGIYLKFTEFTNTLGHSPYDFHDFSRRKTLILQNNRLTVINNNFYIEQSVNLTFEAKYFWVGYDLPYGTGLDASVTDITIVNYWNVPNPGQ